MQSVGQVPCCGSLLVDKRPLLLERSIAGPSLSDNAIMWCTDPAYKFPSVLIAARMCVEVQSSCRAERLRDGLQIVAQLLGKEEAKRTREYIDEQASRGLRALAVANSKDDGKTWTLYGLISLLDPPREDSAETIKEAQSLGVEVKMITGGLLMLTLIGCSSNSYLRDRCLCHVLRPWRDR